ncbi:hypothetical protein [Aquimarina brevivitae]|uniref:Delta-60 repeat protein n=1 Tax=Aquimarina brevivitae TaxID=323412 RepID=A0A4Q7PHT8_9FLAO|nr:hypothetical protein [Aquimarina brevivitae]RZT00162.1 hypothetical protein EV197_1395 [Aquimarina brevivitae]
MKPYCIISLFTVLCFHAYTQQLDDSFSRDGIWILRNPEMTSSQIVDYKLTTDHKLIVLHQSEIKRSITRLLPDGQRDEQFSFDYQLFDNAGTTPVAISTTADNDIVVLANLWNGTTWVINIHTFDAMGELNTQFGQNGSYIKSLTKDQYDNYGQYLYTTANDDIVVVAKINDFSVSTTEHNIATLRLSKYGKTISQGVYANRCQQINSAAMQDDYLLLAYSETQEDELDQTTRVASWQTDQSYHQELHCLSSEEEFSATDQIELSKNNFYIAQIISDAEALYRIGKYDLNGNRDTSFTDNGHIGGDSDIFNSRFVVTPSGEIFVVSMSLDNEFDIHIKKLNVDGTIDDVFGTHGIATIRLNNPVEQLHKIRLDTQNRLYISGNMAVGGNSFGFIARVKPDVLQLKKQKLDDFISTLFTKGE